MSDEPRCTLMACYCPLKESKSLGPKDVPVCSEEHGEELDLNSDLSYVVLEEDSVY